MHNLSVGSLLPYIDIHQPGAVPMSLADIRIVVVFFLIVATTAIISAVFGLRGTYFILGLHSLVNASFVIMALIANGKL